MGHGRSIVTLFFAFASMGLSSLVGQAIHAQQASYKVSGKLVGAPPVLASRFGPTVLFSLNLRPPRSDDDRDRPVIPLILRGTLNADSSFEVSDVPPGTYEFMVNPAGAVLRSIPTIVVTNRDITGLEIPLVRTDVVTNRQNLQTAWSLPGYWSGVATSKDGMYATSPAVDAATTPPFATATLPGHIREIDYHGTIRQEILIPPFRSLRLAIAHFSGSSKPVFLTYGSFVNAGTPIADVHAFDENGHRLWAHPSLDGASDVAVLDSGNNLDSLVVGYATSGLKVLNSDGKLLWESTTNRNVYHVAAGDVRGDGRPEVVASSAFGRVHIFSGAGADIADLDPGTQTSMVRVGKLSEGDPTAAIFAMGAKQTESAATVTSLSSAGKVNWSVQLPSNITPPTIYSASLASGRPWLAVALQGGQVYVVDAKQGTIIGSIDGQSLLPEVGWVAGKDGAAPRLVVSTGNAFNGYTVGGK